MNRTNFPDNLVKVVLGSSNTAVNRKELAVGVSIAMEMLGSRLEEIIRLKYVTGHSVQVLSRMMKLPKKEIERLEQVAIRKLREPSRRVYFEKGLVARLGEKEYSDDYRSGFLKGYLKSLDDQRNPVAEPMTRIEFENPNTDISADIQELSLSDRAEDWLRNNCVNTIEECIELPFGLIVNFENADQEIFTEIAEKVTAYGIHYSDWDDFL